ncbi:MAG: hemolysin family protein [Planctomycetota bacterium]
MPPELLTEMGALAVLLALSAFFSGSETALFSLSRVQVQRLGKGGGRRGRAVAALLARPSRLLITILVGNMVVNTAAASLLAVLAARSRLGRWGVGVAIAASTALLLVFGEITPKTLAVRGAERFAAAAALPLLGFSKLIWPVRCVLRGITSTILFVLRQGQAAARPLLTEREFQAALEVSAEEGVIGEHEREMVEHILEFRDLDAREVMVPRTEMACVEESITVGEAVAAARAAGHSRLPVHTGDLDEVWGIFDLRDLPSWRKREVMGLTLCELVERSASLEQAPKRPLVRPAFLVPESRHVGDLMQDMRQGGEHIAILLDEFGGTAGLVTLQQLIDELVGGMLERGRAGGPLYRLVEGRLQVLGEARLRDVCGELGLVVPPVDADTVGGYVLSLFGRLPRRGEEATDERYRWRVLRMSGRRIGSVEVIPLHGPGDSRGEASP